MVKKPIKARDKEGLLPIDILQKYFNGVVPGEYALARFYEGDHVDLYAAEAWKAVRKTLEIFQQLPDKPWGRMQWGEKPWQSINVKDKWEFLDTYITPVIEKGRPLITQYDQLRSPGADVVEAFDKIAAAKKIDDLRKEEAIAQAINPLPKKRRGGVRKIDPAEVHRLKEEGKTNKEIAAELGCSVSTVTHINVGNECYHGNIHCLASDSPDDRGNHTAYLASSIAAKSPETLIAMQQGKYPSVRAAAIDAGVVKARKTFSVGPTTDPQDFALRLKEGLSDEFLAKLTAALNELVLSNLG